MIRKGLLAVGGLVALQLVFFLGLVLALQVPDEPIVRNLADAVHAGIYGPGDAPDRMGTRSDAFTECVVAGTGLGGDPADGPLRKAAFMPRLSGCEGGAAQIEALAAGEHVEPMSYSKYWAGYVVLTRPVLATLGLEGMRMVAGLLLLGAGVAAFVTVRRVLGTAVAVALVLPVVAGTNLMSTPSTGFSQALSFSVIFATVAALAWATRHSLQRGLVATGVAAALFCYVDLLTAPAIPWALATFVAGSVTWARTGELPHTLRAVVATGLVWPAVFALTWVSRWAIGALLLGPGYMLDLIRQNVEFRTGGDHAGVEHHLGAAIGRNIGSWWFSVPTAPLVLAACIVVAGVALWRLRSAGRRAWPVLPVLTLAALIPFAWYEVLSNHSQIHAFYTNRGVPTALAIATAACWVPLVTWDRPAVDELRAAGEGRHPRRHGAMGHQHPPERSL